MEPERLKGGEVSADWLSSQLGDASTDGGAAPVYGVRRGASVSTHAGGFSFLGGGHLIGIALGCRDDLMSRPR